MIHYAETHGIEMLIGYYILISILGTMPPLPPTASYMQRWGFSIAHAICGNMKNMMAAMSIPAPKEADTSKKETFQ